MLKSYILFHTNQLEPLKLLNFFLFLYDSALLLNTFFSYTFYEVQYYSTINNIQFQKSHIDHMTLLYRIIFLFFSSSTANSKALTNVSSSESPKSSISIACGCSTLVTPLKFSSYFKFHDVEA